MAQFLKKLTLLFNICVNYFIPITLKLKLKQNCNKYLMLPKSKLHYADESSFELELDQQQIYGSLRRSRKKGKSCGVNTSKALLFNSSFQLIQPITHLQFQQQSTEKYINDGINQEFSVPNKTSAGSPIYKSQSTASKTQNLFNSTKLKASQPKNMIRVSKFNPQNVEFLKGNSKQSERIQKIVYNNLKNLQMGQDQVKQSRRRSQKFVPVVEFEDKPVMKKGFKISAPFKLSQSKLTAKKQILEEAKKMIGSGSKVQKIGEQKYIVETEKSRSKSRSKSKQHLSNSQNKYNYQNASRTRCQLQPDSSPQTLYIHLLAPISLLKQALIESQECLNLSFSIPSNLFQTPTPTTSLTVIKQLITQIFLEAGLQTFIISIKKYVDRVEIKNKNLCIIWGYDGSGYFGEWKGGQILANMNRHGVGLEWGNLGDQGEMHYGEHRDDKREGYGVLKHKSGQTYVGCWKDGKKQGWGKLYGADHRLKCKGEFTNDIFMGCP